MNKNSFIFNIVLASILILSIHSNACTTAVISGKYTKSGKPMLWKNRDTDYIKNYLCKFDDGKYKYMGLINSADPKGKNVWIGVNEMGFAIMNSASYNLNRGDTTKLFGSEGRLMKEALASCKNLEEFEKYLNALAKPTRFEANFGVIDAEGGAAYYELNNKGYHKFDANNPDVAPFGYLIRANYSHSGLMGGGSGYIRYNTANKFFYQQASTVGLTPQFIEQNVSKTLYHSLIDEDLFEKYGNFEENTPTYRHFVDFIPRSLTSSSVTIEGVKSGENPALCSMWSDVGFPLASIVVPTWLADNVAFPGIVNYNAEIEDSPISNAALELKDTRIYNIRWGEKDRTYININALSNKEGTGIRQIIKKYENEIYNKANALNDKMNKSGKIDKTELTSFYSWLDSFIRNMYKKEFGIELKI
jgi:hypothetical protein